jgi:hypothetical protein
MAQPGHHRGIGQLTGRVATPQFDGARFAIGVDEFNPFEITSGPVNPALGFKHMGFDFRSLGRDDDIEIPELKPLRPQRLQNGSAAGVTDPAVDLHIGPEDGEIKVAPYFDRLVGIRPRTRVADGAQTAPLGSPNP